MKTVPREHVVLFQEILCYLAKGIADSVVDQLADRTPTSKPVEAGLSIKQTATRLSVSCGTVRKMLDDGRLSYTRVNKRIVVPSSEIERLLCEAAATTRSSGGTVVELPCARAAAAGKKAARNG